MQEAVDDCRQKNEAANQSIYGELRYILMIATAGASMQVLAVPVDDPDGLHPILPTIQVACSLPLPRVRLHALAGKPITRLVVTAAPAFASHFKMAHLAARKQYGGQHSLYIGEL